MSKINWSLANKRKNAAKPEKTSCGEDWLKKNDPKLVDKLAGAAASSQSKQASERKSNLSGLIPRA